MQTPNSLNTQITNYGLSTQNSAYAPYVFSQEVGASSINVPQGSQANIFSQNNISSPQEIPSFFLKQNYLSNQNIPNTNQLVQLTQFNQQQIIKPNQDLVRSSSCNDMKRFSSHRNIQSTEYNDRSCERSSIAQGTEIFVPKHNSSNDGSILFNYFEKTPTRQNPINSSQNLQMSLRNSNSKKFRELEDQIKELVNENTKMSQLLEEKGYLLQQLEDEKIVQKLMQENSDLKEKIHQLTIRNDLNIQNKVLNTENFNLNKIISEKMQEISELKNIVQNKMNSSIQIMENEQKICEQENSITLLIQENEQLGDLLKQSQADITKLMQENSDFQKKIMGMQSQVQNSFENQKNYDQVINQLRNLEQQHNKLEINSVPNEKFINLKNELDNSTRALVTKEQELSQLKQQYEKEKKQNNKEAERQITKLIEENEKLNDIISQYYNSNSDTLINSGSFGKPNQQITMGKDDQQKLMVYESLQNCNKDYEEKITQLINQNKNLEEIIVDIEKDRSGLAENLEFMEERLKQIEHSNKVFKSQFDQGEDHQQDQNQNLQSIHSLNQRIQELEQNYKDLSNQYEFTCQKLTIKNEENKQKDQQLEENQIQFNQIMEQKTEQISLLNQQLQEQVKYIEQIQLKQEDSVKKSQKNNIDQNNEKKQNDINLKNAECFEINKQFEQPDSILQELIGVIQGQQQNIFYLQNKLKEIQPDIVLDNILQPDIKQLEDKIQLINQSSTKINSGSKKNEFQHEFGDQLNLKEALQQNQKQLTDSQQIQSMINKNIELFEQKYQLKIQDMQREFEFSLNEREEKIIEIVNENSKLLELNEQRLVELQILSQQVDQRDEQIFRETKTIEELQKKVQMLLSKNIQQNKGILKTTSIYQSSSERSLIDSIQEEESEESQQEIENQKPQCANTTFETKRLQTKLEEKRKKISILKQEIETFKEKLLDYEEIEFKLNQQNRQLQEELRHQYSQKEDINKLNEMLKTRKNEYNELKKRYEAIRQEKDDLHQKLKTKQQDLSPTDKDNSFSNLEFNQEIVDMYKKENGELKQTNESLITQIKRKEKELSEKSEELDQIKNKYNEQLLNTSQ